MMSFGFGLPEKTDIEGWMKGFARVLDWVEDIRDTDLVDERRASSGLQ